MRTNKSDFDHMKAEEAVDSLESSLERGLKSVKIERRLGQYGYNEIPEKKTRLSEDLKKLSECFRAQSKLLHFTILPTRTLRLNATTRIIC